MVVCYEKLFTASEIDLVNDAYGADLYHPSIFICFRYSQTIYIFICRQARKRGMSRRLRDARSEVVRESLLFETSTQDPSLASSHLTIFKDRDLLLDDDRLRRRQGRTKSELFVS